MHCRNEVRLETLVHMCSVRIPTVFCVPCFGMAAMNIHLFSFLFFHELPSLLSAIGDKGCCWFVIGLAAHIACSVRNFRSQPGNSLLEEQCLRSINHKKKRAEFHHMLLVIK